MLHPLLISHTNTPSLLSTGSIVTPIFRPSLLPTRSRCAIQHSTHCHYRPVIAAGRRYRPAPSLPVRQKHSFSKSEWRKGFEKRFGDDGRRCWIDKRGGTIEISRGRRIRPSPLYFHVPSSDLTGNVTLFQRDNDDDDDEKRR